MACDRQMTYGTQKFKTLTKVLALEGSVPKEMYGVNKCFIGFSGTAEYWGRAVEWFADPTQKRPKLKDIEFLMLTDKKKIYHSTNLRNWMLIPEKHFAIGSGMQFAIAAMTAGKTPKEAVDVASKHDNNTGFGIVNYDFKEEKT